MENLWRDLRLSLRQLVKDPGFTAAVLVALALGIGATSATLTLVEAVLLAQLPFEEPSRLVVLGGTYDEQGEIVDWPISQMDFEDFRRESASFEAMSVFTPGDFAANIGAEHDPERANGELVSASYFSLLGLRPALGRFFTPDEDEEPFEDYVVVLGHALWTRRFGADPGVVGEFLDINGERYEIVGVAPERFRGLSDRADVWIPSKLPPKPFYLTNRRLRWLSAVARLSPGVTPQQAQDEMNRLASALEEQFPTTNAGIGVRVTPLREHWFGKLRQGLVILTASAVILLLIASVNVANLMLSRAIREQRSQAIRMALGADRRRVLRQLLTHSLLISLIGAALGLLLARWATPALVAASGVEFQSFVDLTPRPPVVAAIAVLALLCGLVFGAVPMWITFQADLTHNLTRQGVQPARGFGRQRFQNAVVVAQVALALLLSVGAGLTGLSFQRMIRQDLGFRSADLLTFRVDLRGEKFARDEPVLRLIEEYLERLPQVAGVERVAIAGPTLPTDAWTGGYVTYEDHSSDAPDGTYPMMVHSVSPDYFQMLKVPIVLGRAFTSRDRESFSVVVSQRLADEHWPGESPLGKRLKIGERAAAKPWLSVVGVAADVRHQGLQGDERPAPDLYLPILQFPWRPLNVNFLVRPESGVGTYALVQTLRREMRAIAPDVPIYDVASLEERLRRQTDKARFQVVLVSLVTVLALVLAVVGIYGVVAYGVVQRRREIAIRMSLGADRARILRMVVVRGALLAALGLALGLAAVLVLGRQLAGSLYETSATDPLILGGASLALFLVTLAANYLPARRAANLEPVSGLRTE